MTSKRSTLGARHRDAALESGDTSPQSKWRPYPKYKDSGVEWLGEIPGHWNAKRIKTIARLNTGGTPAGLLDEAFEFEGVPWVKPDNLNGDHGIAAPDRKLSPTAAKALGIVKAGSSLVCGIGTVGKTGHAPFEVCTNQQINAITFRNEVNDRFGHFTVSCLTHEFERRANKVTLAICNKSEMGEVSMCVPSLVEQRLITVFLDRETAKIDALIEKNERLIELLQEKRTALITQAVTKGIDPTVPMKDSGIEWLGKIPAHWEFIALSRVTLSRCDGPFGSGLKSEHYSEVGVRVIRLQNIGWTEFSDADQAFIDEDYANELGDHSVMTGDLLIAGLGDEGHPVGRACVSPDGIEPAMVKADCFRFRLDRRRVVPHFASYQLSVTALAAAGSLATGATRARMNLTVTASRKIALPPPDEQRVIIEAVEYEGEKYLALIAKVRGAIDRLKEYRTTLISAAVTGKIDVRISN